MRIVTFACDKYADIAPAYHFLLTKNWPDHPPLIYVTNSAPLKVDAETVYIKGADIKYGWRLRRFIQNHYREDLIILMMIDYLVKGVNLDLIEKATKLCERDDVGHVRLRPMPHPQLPWPDEDFGEVKKNTAYALSLQPGIWDTKLIHDLCRDNESAHHTETRGSRRMHHVKLRLLSVKEKMAIAHHNYYRYGKPKGIEWVMKNVPRSMWPTAAKKRGKK